MNADDKLTREEAAKELRVSLSTMKTLLRTKIVPYVKLRGRVLILRKDLDAVIARHRVPANWEILG